MFDKIFQRFLLVSAHLSVCVFDNLLQTHKSVLKKATETIYTFLDCHPPPPNFHQFMFLKPKIVQGSKIQLFGISISLDSFNW